MNFLNLIKMTVAKKGLDGQLLRGGGGVLVVKSAAMLLTLAVAVSFARILGPAGYGTYSYVVTLVTLMAIPAQFGLPNLVVRETAKAHAREDWSSMKSIWRWATVVALCSALVIIVAAGCVALITVERFDEVQLTAFIYGLILVPLVALGNLRGAALRGLRHVVKGQVPEHLLRPAILLCITAFVIWYGLVENFQADTAIGLTAIAALCAFLIGTILLRRVRPVQLASKLPCIVYQHRTWLATVLPMALVAGMNQVNKHTDIVMLGWLSGTEDVGIYSVATQGATLVIFGLTVANMVVAPYFARLYEQGDIERLQRIVTLSARAILAVAVPIVAILVLWGAPLMRLIFGESFMPAADPMAILAIGQLINAMMGSVGTLLTMTGHERDVAKGVAVAAFCNIAFNACLIPILGTQGAALATSMSIVVWNVILWRLVKIRLSIKSTAFNF